MSRELAFAIVIWHGGILLGSGIGQNDYMLIGGGVVVSLMGLYAGGKYER